MCSYGTAQGQHRSHLHSTVWITWVTCGSLCQFECFSAPCLKGTTIEHRISEHYNSQKLQVVRSTQNDTQSMKNEQGWRCLRAVPYVVTCLKL